MRISAGTGKALAGFAAPGQTPPDPIHIVFIGQSMFKIHSEAVVTAAMDGLTYSYYNGAYPGASYKMLHHGGMDGSGIPIGPARDRIWPYLTGQFNLVVFLGGTTDLGFDGDSAATTYANLLNFAAEAREAGADACIAGTVMPSVFFSAGEEVERQAFNSTLLTNSGSPFEGVFDVTVAPLNDYTDTTYWEVDQLHWNVTGCAIGGAMVQTAIVAMFA